MYEIVERKQLNPQVFLLEIDAPHVVLNAEPGQFVIVIAEEEGERIPLTIADMDKEKETVSIVVQAVGASTVKMSQLKKGEYIMNILGPLGEAAPIIGYKNVLVIGGGVGIAPLFPQMKQLKAEGAHVDSILGGRTEDLIILKEDFEAISDTVHYSTNDGSLGTKGFVTDVLKEMVENGTADYDLIVAIGPLVMMKAVCDYTKAAGIKTNVSLNPIMIDGTGMCGGCRVSVGGETRFACVHGPDFDGHLVDFEEAILRQGMYKKEEAHKCNLDKAVVL